LLDAVKRCRGDAVRGLAMYCKRNNVTVVTPEMRGYAVGVGRTPFPNIKGLPEGPFPVYKDRPWYDARRWETDEQRAWDAEVEALDV
jgi:hypothetical protein